MHDEKFQRRFRVAYVLTQLEQSFRCNSCRVGLLIHIGTIEGQVGVFIVSETQLNSAILLKPDSPLQRPAL